MYVSIIGGISVSDSYGLIGGVYTNSPPVAVSAIITASYPSWPSTCRPQGENAEAVINPLTLSDIACPTWGLSDPPTTSCGGSAYLTETYGAPYNPIILVLTELVSIDPAWAACTTDPNAALLTLPCGIYDPPKALSTAAAMVPADDPDPKPSHKPTLTLQHHEALAPGVTSANDPTTPITSAAAPANSGSPSLLQPTTVANSGGGDPSEKSSQKESDPAAGHQSSDPDTSGSGKSDEHLDSDPNKSDPNSSDPKASGQTSQSGSQKDAAPVPASGSTQKQSPNNRLTIVKAPTTINLGGEAQATSSVGAFINGGFGGGSVPAPSSAPSPVFTPHVVTALGQTLSITDPSTVVITRSTLSVSGAAHTFNERYFSLAPSGNLIAGILAPSPKPSSPPLISSC